MVWVFLLCAVTGATGDVSNALVATAFSSFIFFLRRRWPVALLCAMSTVWGLLCVHSLEADRRVWTAENPHTLSGVVSGFPSSGRYGASFPFETSVGGRHVRVRVLSKRFDTHYGERLELTGTMRKMRYPIAGIAGVFRARSVGRNDVASGSLVTRYLWPAHLRSRTVLSRRLGSHSALPLALALGERGFVTSRQRTRFKRLGISHLFALSGMHLGIMAAAFYLLVPWRSGRATALAALVLASFVLLVGDVNSLERALAMALLALLARALGRPIRALHVWACAACILLWRDPVSFGSVGLQFSLLATLGVIVTLERMRGLSPRIRGAGWLARTIAGALGTIAVGIGATLAVLPLQLHYFEVVSPVGPLATVVFAPVAASLLIASLVLVLVHPVPGVAGLAEWVVLTLARVLEAMLGVGGSLPIPLLRPEAPDPVVYYMGALVVGAPVGWRVRSVGVLVLALSFVA